MATYINRCMGIITRYPGGTLLYGLEVEWSGVIRLINPILYTSFVHLIISQMAYTVDSYCMGHDWSLGGTRM